MLCHGVLAPVWHQLPPTTRLNSAARTTLSAWFNVLDVRQSGVMPLSLSACSQGLFRIDPRVIRVPDAFIRRFRTNRARKSNMQTGTTFVVDVKRNRSSPMLGGNCSEHRTKHHSHSTPSVLSRYGGSADCWIDPRALCAAFTTRRSAPTSMTTLLQPRQGLNASRTDCSVAEGSHRSSTLSGRDTISTKTIPGASERSMSCTCWPDRYLQPGIFCPYKNAANSLLGTMVSPHQSQSQDSHCNSNKRPRFKFQRSPTKQESAKSSRSSPRCRLTPERATVFIWCPNDSTELRTRVDKNHRLLGQLPRRGSLRR